MEENTSNLQYEILNSHSMESDYKFKVIVIGDSNVGKSCLTYRAIKNDFTGTQSSTIGYDYSEFTLKIKDTLDDKAVFGNELNDFQLPITARDKIIKLSIWDTCGQEQYRSLVKCFFNSSSMAFIVYSIDRYVFISIYISFPFSYKSFASINDWVKQVKTLAAINCKLILIGNKSDLNEDLRKVTYEQGQKLAFENNMSFFIETSAKDGQNVKELFINSAYLLYYDYLKIQNHQTIDEGMIEDFLKPSQPSEKKSCC